MKSLRKPKVMPPDLRVVLDWLCRQPARVFDFSEVADALKMKRAEVEKAFGRLRHQDFGGHLTSRGPDGNPLRNRFAYLPPDAKCRSGYAVIEHPKAAFAPHPTYATVERNRLEKEAEEAAAQKRHEDDLRERAKILLERKVARKAAQAAAFDEEPTPVFNQPKNGKAKDDDRRNDRSANTGPRSNASAQPQSNPRPSVQTAKP